MDSHIKREVFEIFNMIRKTLSKTDTFRTGTKCPSYKESNKRSKERQGPTLGVRLIEVSVKRKLTVFSLRYINFTLGLLPPRRHVIWRDSVAVESSRVGRARLRGYFSSELSLVVTPC